MRTLLALTLLLALLVPALCLAQQPQVNLANPLLKGLTSWWRGVQGLSQSTTVYDLVPGRRNTGTMAGMGTGLGAPGWSASSRPGGLWQLNFDGSASVIATTNLAGLTNTTPFTLCLWMNIVAGTSQATMLSTMLHNSFDGVQLIAGQSSDTKPRLTMGATAGTNEEIQVNTALSTGTWYHLCATYDGSQTIGGMALYVNSLLQAVTTTVNSGFGTFPDRIWRIGSDGPTVVRPFNGALDDIMLFNRALSAGEIMRLWQESRTGYVGLSEPLSVVFAPGGAPGSFFPFFGR